MIIHTIMPMDVVLKQDDPDSHNEIIDYGQIKLEVKSIENREYEVIRIISTNPRDYLNDNIKPGSILKARYFPGDR